MASFSCYDNSDVIATLIMTNFHLNTTVVAIFPNVCLWRRSLCSNLVLTGSKLTACIEPPSYASTAFVVVIWPSFLFDSFVEIWATCESFFGQMVYRPSSWQKISCTAMNHRTANVARTPSIKWELKSNWLTAGKEYGSILSSRLWGGGGTTLKTDV